MDTTGQPSKQKCNRVPTLGMFVRELPSYELYVYRGYPHDHSMAIISSRAVYYFQRIQIALHSL